jgi:hypothetical protein
MRARFASGLASLILLPTAATAAGLATTNESALARGFAIPAYGQPDVPAAGDGGWIGSIDLSSEFEEQDEGDEALRLDGETQRWTLRYRRGFSSDWEANVEIPLLHVGGGFLDSAIENWHDAFGLPQGGRKEAPQDRFSYRYVRDGVTELAVEDGGTGLGDVRVGVGRALADGLVLRAQLKLPTGDEDLLGGGNFGGATWIDWALPMPAASGVSGFLSGGLSAQAHADAMPSSMQNTVIPFGGVGLGVHVVESFEILAQLEAHAPLFDHTEMDALKRAGLQFVLGARWCYSASQCLELSFQEDPVVASSPDFSLRLAFVAR